MNDKSMLKSMYYKINTTDEKQQNKYIPRKKKSKKSKRLSIGYTEDEYKIIENKSKEAGISKAAYIRESSLGNVIRHEEPSLIAKIVEIDEKINQAVISKNVQASLFREEFNELKNEFFID